ncbi:MAG TPA: hypothetical protein VIL51_01325, partial [Thermoleophilia bacterium]
MPARDETAPFGEGDDRLLEHKAVSRRDFLRVAGLAGVAMGMGAGLGGLVAACGGTSGTTTTTAAVTSTTAAPASSTTVTTGATAGREIKVGFVTPLTGPIALFGVPDQYCASRWVEFAKPGLVCGDG